jgi:esterase/lipase
MTDKKQAYQFDKSITFKKESKDCVVIFHGFSATPYEMHELAEAIAKLPVDVHVPMIIKHGIDSKTLATLEMYEAINWGVEYITKKIKQYSRVFVIGHSLGAGICFAIASLGLDIKGAILSGIGKEFSLKARVVTWLAEKLGIKYLPGMFTELKKAPNISEEYVEWKKRNLPKQPISLMRDVVTNVPDEYERTGDIKVPIMTILGTEDFLIEPKYIDDFLAETQSRRKVSIMLNDSGHRIFLTEYKDTVIARIMTFLEELLESDINKQKDLAQCFILDGEEEINRTDQLQEILADPEKRKQYKKDVCTP